MTDREAQRTMASKVVELLNGTVATDQFVRDYWRTRRELLSSNWSAFEGAFGEIMSRVDTAVDSYRPEDRADFEIDEQQLRTELTSAIDHLSAELPDVLG